MSFENNTRPRGRARGMPAPCPDPLAGLRDDLVAALALLEGRAVTALATLGRQRDNRLGQALEATRRELRRALEAAGAGGPGPG